MIQASELRDAAAQLPALERAELAEFLLNGLEETSYWIDNNEVARRREELSSGQVSGLTLEEFKIACGR